MASRLLVRRTDQSSVSRRKVRYAGWLSVAPVGAATGASGADSRTAAAPPAITAEADAFENEAYCNLVSPLSAPAADTTPIATLRTQAGLGPEERSHAPFNVHLPATTS
jgi:hypothetical protein